MTLEIKAQPLPLTRDVDGVVRVGGTRVTLDAVIAAFLEGATAEEIGYQYPALSLSDIYSALGYYLQQRAEVDEYLQSRQRQAKLIREQNEARYDPHGVRDRLLARRAKSE